MAEPKLNARSVILSTLLGTDPPELPVSALVAVTDLFGLGEGTVRTSLSRMAARGEITTGGDGRYRLAGAVARPPVEAVGQPSGRAPRVVGRMAPARRDGGRVATRAARGRAATSGHRSAARRAARRRVAAARQPAGGPSWTRPWSVDRRAGRVGDGVARPRQRRAGRRAVGPRRVVAARHRAPARDGRRSSPDSTTATPMPSLPGSSSARRCCATSRQTRCSPSSCSVGRGPAAGCAWTTTASTARIAASCTPG